MAFLDKLFQRKKNKVTREEMINEPVKKRMSYQVANLQGIGARNYQEDSFAVVNAMDVTEIRKEGLFAVLADGMGGMENGKQASEMAVSCLKNSFFNINREEDIAQQLKDAMIDAGNQIHSKYGRRSGTTAIACMFYEENLYFASIGDSSLYLKRGHKLLQLNREQNYREHLLRKMVHNSKWNIDAAYNDPEADCLMQFLGKADMDEPDYLVRPFPLEEGDQILMCSDGISKVLSNEELLACLDGNDVLQACEWVERMILRNQLSTQDNYTMILISCTI